MSRRLTLRSLGPRVDLAEPTCRRTMIWRGGGKGPPTTPGSFFEAIHPGTPSPAPDQPPGSFFEAIRRNPESSPDEPSEAVECQCCGPSERLREPTLAARDREPMHPRQSRAFRQAPERRGTK